MQMRRRGSVLPNGAWRTPEIGKIFSSTMEQILPFALNSACLTTGTLQLYHYCLLRLLLLTITRRGDTMHSLKFVTQVARLFVAEFRRNLLHAQIGAPQKLASVFVSRSSGKVAKSDAQI